MNTEYQSGKAILLHPQPMKNIRFSIIILFLSAYPSILFAQQSAYRYALDPNDTLVRDARLYAGLLHQHQDFFQQAFSYQGIETGLILNKHLMLGLFGAAFVSNLSTESQSAPLYVNIWKAGLSLGNLYKSHEVLHAGWLFHVGYFSLIGNQTNMALFKSNEASVRVKGLLFSPELFAELNLTRWMKIRTGVAYGFHSFEKNAFVEKSDLQQISLNFGFLFSKFSD